MKCLAGEKITALRASRGKDHRCKSTAAFVDPELGLAVCWPCFWWIKEFPDDAADIGFAKGVR